MEGGITENFFQTKMEIGDGLVVIGIALVVLAIFSPVIVSELTKEPESNYQSCIQKCPSNFNGKFKDLECPEMCERLKNCEDKTPKQKEIKNEKHN